MYPVWQFVANYSTASARCAFSCRATEPEVFLIFQVQFVFFPFVNLWRLGKSGSYAEHVLVEEMNICNLRGAAESTVSSEGRQCGFNCTCVECVFCVDLSNSFLFFLFFFFCNSIKPQLSVTGCSLLCSLLKPVQTVQRCWSDTVRTSESNYADSQLFLLRAHLNMKETKRSLGVALVCRSHSPCR